jgi:hypothetical protein
MESTGYVLIVLRTLEALRLKHANCGPGITSLLASCIEVTSEICT